MCLVSWENGESLLALYRPFCYLLIVMIPDEMLMNCACCAVMRTRCSSGDDKSHAIALFFIFSFNSEMESSFFSWFANSKSNANSYVSIALSSFARAVARKDDPETRATATAPNSILFVASITYRTSDIVPIVEK